MSGPQMLSLFLVANASWYAWCGKTAVLAMD
jgi:hypothetical protein